MAKDKPKIIKVILNLEVIEDDERYKILLPDFLALKDIEVVKND